MAFDNGYRFAFLDEGSKREIRRSVIKAISIPGYQVPFDSRELPIGRGWGSGGIQLTLALIGPEDVLKVIDQGSDDSVNAISIRRLVARCTGVETTADTGEATLIQSRHRVPEEPMKEGQTLILQVPTPEPLRIVEKSVPKARQMHADQNYSGAWLSLYEQIVRYGKITMGSNYPVMVDGRYLMAPTPIPRYDTLRLDNAECLCLFGAGREKMIYAVPPYTSVVPLDFEDYAFETEDISGRTCRLCGAKGLFFDEMYDEETGEKYYQCSDTSFCEKTANGGAGYAGSPESE